MLQISQFTSADQAVVKRIAQNLQVLETELNMIYPERQWLIRQILLCLVTGGNILVYGPHGTAKTKLAKAIFRAITGPGIKGEEKYTFTIQLDTESTLDDVVGPLDVKVMNNDGDLVRKVARHMPVAHYVILDEFFEALSVLRALNDMLNEKEYMSGAQQLKVPLLSAIATTNRGPREIEQLFSMLSLPSVNDRFMAVSEVGYIKEDEGMDRMLDNYLMNVEPISTVAFSDMQRITQVIQKTNQFPSPEYREVYRTAMNAYEKKAVKKGLLEPSDRRIAWLTQMVEAEAILNGRTNLFLDDILAARYGLATHAESAEAVTFMETVPPILDQAKIDLKEDAGKVERDHLTRIGSELATVKAKVSDASWSSVATPAVVGRTIDSLMGIKTALTNMKPTTSSARDQKEALLKEQEKVMQKVLNSRAAP